MSEIAQTNLVKLGRDAAVEVAGLDAVLDVRAEPDVDERDRLVYQFTFVIDRSLTPAYGPGEMRTKLSMLLRDRLIDQGDETYPFLRIISPEEWRAGAGG